MDIFLFVILGVGVGLLGTLIGAGGGFILLPVLTLLYPEWPAERVSAVSLFVVLCNALSGTIGYSRMKRIDYRSGLIFAAAALPGALVGAAATHFASRSVFNTILGVCLLLISGFLLVRNYLKPVDGTDAGPAAQRQTTRQRTVGVSISLAVGVISSFLGIGGGIIHVPALIYVLGFPVHVAIATSHFVLAITAAAGTGVKLFGGEFGDALPIAMAIGVGAVVGAQAGAYLSRKIHSMVIVNIMAAAMLAVAVRILWIGLRGS
ncbi:MAG: sulfite exporter TauE/SafE family protein [Phycisphaerales bacterium]